MHALAQVVDMMHQALRSYTTANPRTMRRGARSSSEGIEGNSAVGLLPPLNAVQREKPAFVASKRFSGRRAGYVFTKGPKGLGFYLDKRAAPASAPAKKLKASAQRGAVQATPVVSAAKKSQLAGKPAAATPAASKPAAGKPAESKGKKRTSPYDEDDDEMVGSVPERAASKGKAAREQEASAPHAAAKGGKAGGKAKKIASPYDDDDDLIGSLPGRLSKVRVPRSSCLLGFCAISRRSCRTVAPRSGNVCHWVVAWALLHSLLMWALECRGSSARQARDRRVAQMVSARRKPSLDACGRSCRR